MTQLHTPVIAGSLSCICMYMDSSIVLVKNHAITKWAVLYLGFLFNGGAKCWNSDITRGGGGKPVQHSLIIMVTEISRRGE